MRIVGIGSGGGHLTELTLVLRHLPGVVAILTERNAAARAAPGLPCLPLTDPHRSALKFLVTLAESIAHFWRLRPDVVVSTGAGMTLPFFLVARLLGARCIFLETGARVTKPSLTGRVCYPLSHLFIVQNPALRHRFRRAVTREIFRNIRALP